MAFFNQYASAIFLCVFGKKTIDSPFELVNHAPRRRKATEWAPRETAPPIRCESERERAYETETEGKGSRDEDTVVLLHGSSLSFRDRDRDDSEVLS